MAKKSTHKRAKKASKTNANPRIIGLFRYVSPYIKKNKTRFPFAQKKPGVYLIKENDKIVYIGSSFKKWDTQTNKPTRPDVYKAMYHHFQNWDDDTQKRVIYKAFSKTKKYTVRLILTNTSAQAERLEKLLIIKHKPRDNSYKYLGYAKTKIDDRILWELQAKPVDGMPPHEMTRFASMEYYAELKKQAKKNLEECPF